MPQVSKTYQDFSKGLNDTLSAVVLNEAEAATARNSILNERGILEKAKGYIKDHTAFTDASTNFIRMLLNYKRGTSVNALIEAANDSANTNASYKVDLKQTTGAGTSAYIGHTAGTDASFTNGNTAVTGVGTTWSSHLKAGDKIKATSHSDSVYGEISTVNSDTSITLTANYAGATAANVPYIARIILHKDFIPRSAVFNNSAIITNGSEKPMTWNNTTLNKITDTDCPSAKFIEVHKSRVFMANTTSANSRIFWSAVNDESSWDAAGFEDVFPQDNGSIIAIKSFGDSLVVLKNNGNIYQVAGNFDQSAVGEPTFIRKVDVGENIGIIAERTPVVHNGMLYFVAQTGLYSIDPRMRVEKVTYNLENLFGGVNFTLGPTSSKAHTYDTETQWDTGTLDGTVSATTGEIKPYFDTITISDAYQGLGKASVAIDSSNNVHVAYVDYSDIKKIKYKKWSASTNTFTLEETARVETASGTDAICLSLDVSSSGLVGIAFRTSNSSGDALLRYVERSAGDAGTWGSTESVGGLGSGGITYWGISLRFGTDNVPRIAVSQNSSTSKGNGYATKVSGSWVLTELDNNIEYFANSLTLDGSNQPRISYLTQDGASRSLKQIKSDNETGGSGTWSTIESFSITTSTVSTDGIQNDINSSNQIITGFSDSSGKIKVRNHSTTTTTEVDTDSTCEFKGFQLRSDLTNCYYTLTSSSLQVEKVTFEGSSTITNTVANNINTFCGDRSLHHNGRVFASITFGANANEILLRRVAYKSTWTGPEVSDSTLTAWGTYDVAQSTNTATVLHEVATATASPATSYATITNGQIVSSDSAKVFARARITITLGTFAQPEVQSVILNYTGTGIDAKQLVAMSFNNELYIAYAESAETANNKVLKMDRDGAFVVLDYPISAMERFNGYLYAGKSTNADLLILENGHNYAGSAYTMDWISKEDFLGSVELLKRVNKIFVLFEVKQQGSFDFSYRTDNFATYGGSSWNTTTITQTQDGRYEILVGKTCKSIQFRVENDTIDDQVGVLAFVVVYEPQVIH